MVADGPVDLAPPLGRDRRQHGFLDPVVDELELVLGLHDQALAQSRLQHLERLDQAHFPDFGNLGRRKGIAHACAVFEKRYEILRELPDLRGEKRDHGGRHVGLPDLVQVPAPLPVAV